MLNSMYYLKDSISRLRRISQMIEKHIEKEQTEKLELNFIQNNVLNAIADAKCSLQEFTKSVSSSKVPLEFLRLETILPYAVTAIKKEDISFEDLNKEIKGLIAPMNNYSDESYDYFQDYHYQYSETALLRDREMNRDIFNSLVTAIGDFRGFKILETNSYQAALIGYLSELEDAGIEKYVTYEESYDVSPSVRSICSRIAIGKFNTITATHEAFDFIYCNPPIDVKKKSANAIQRTERENLMKSITLLSPGGVLIYAIPIASLRLDICTYIAKALTNIQIRLTADNIIYIIGNKNNSTIRIIDEEMQNKLHQLILLDDYSLTKEYDINLNRTLEPIDIVRSNVPVKMFRGNKIDSGELEFLYSSSPCVRQFLKDQKGKSLTAGDRRPPLPFTTGQLGLILTSGCLDGKVEDEDGYAHVVKGRIVKTEENITNSNESTGETSTTLVSANRVELELFLPDGSYKRLA